MLGSRRVGVRAGQQLFVCILTAALSCAYAGAAVAQSDEHDDDHDHGGLHFSHPLITESPSPDTKVRLDAAFARSDEAPGTRATSLTGEVEYAFSHSFSLAVVAPFVRIAGPGAARTSGLGSVELSAKAASFAFAESGVLLGAGMTVAFPTGNDAKGIGSGHLYELAPFVDAAVKRGDVEAVGFLTYSTAVNRDAGEPSSNAVTFDGSLMWRFVPQIELLAEITTSRAVGSSAGAYTETFLAPGIKWRPASFPKLAFGVAAIRGVGQARGTNAVKLTAFYHF